MKYSLHLHGAEKTEDPRHPQPWEAIVIATQALPLLDTLEGKQVDKEQAKQS